MAPARGTRADAWSGRMGHGTACPQTQGPGEGGRALAAGPSPKSGHGAGCVCTVAHVLLLSRMFRRA